MFNYYRCTMEELVAHVLSSTSLTITKAKRYHTAKGNLDVVDNINKAREIASITRLENKLEHMKRN